MGDYTEHLISMAGGDGDVHAEGRALVANIHERKRKAGMRDLNQIHALLGSVAFPETPEERDEAEAALLAVVRSQQAKIERALVLANSSPNTFLGRDIRAALTATEGA